MQKDKLSRIIAYTHVHTCMHYIYIYIYIYSDRLSSIIAYTHMYTHVCTHIYDFYAIERGSMTVTQSPTALSATNGRNWCRMPVCMYVYVYAYINIYI